MRTPRQVNVHEAKTQLSRLLAEVERGREIIVARAGVPVAKLVPFPSSVGRLRVGNWKGKITIARDFDAPLTEAELREWGF
jgi:prevent-host-death family protein